MGAICYYLSPDLCNQSEPISLGVWGEANAMGSQRREVKGKLDTVAKARGIICHESIRFSRTQDVLEGGLSASGNSLPRLNVALLVPYQQTGITSASFQSMMQLERIEYLPAVFEVQKWHRPGRSLFSNCIPCQQERFPSHPSPPPSQGTAS